MTFLNKQRRLEKTESPLMQTAINFPQKQKRGVIVAFAGQFQMQFREH